MFLDIFIVLYIYFIIFNKADICSLDIKESGVIKINPGDVGMVLYITVKNPCKHVYELSAEMQRCKEILDQEDEETEAMYLIGGYMGILKSYSSIEVTLIYPNMYLYNRKATCHVAITYMNKNNDSRVIETYLRIDTTLRDDVPPKEIKSFYPHNICTCDTIDQDELDQCQPVNCIMKYLGYRSFYNKTRKRCMKVPICVADSQLDEPDVSYIPQYNKCRNLNCSISENDLDKLENGFVNNITDKNFSANGLQFRCNHGSLDPKTGYCQCYKGWTSGETDLDAYLPSLNIYHMCNIKLNSWKGENIEKIRKTVLAFSIVGIVVAIAVVIITISLYALYQRVKSVSSKSQDCKYPCE